MTEDLSAKNVSPRDPPQDIQRYLKCLEERCTQLVELLYCVASSPEDAEDAAHDAIVEALQLVKARSVEGLRDRWAWLKEVGRNKARAHRRQRRTYLSVEPDMAPVYPFADFEDEEERRVVRLIIDSLPLPIREVFISCQLEEVTYAQAAERFQISEGTIRHRLRTAFRMLKRRVKI